MAAFWALPQPSGALTIRTEGAAGCLAVDHDTPAGLAPEDRNAIVRTDCAEADEWAAKVDGVGQVAAAYKFARMCLSVDFRRSLLGQGQTFNVFAAADCDTSVIWEIRNGFIVAEFAATVYCLEAVPDPAGGPSNAIARIGCSGADDGVWVLE